MLMGPYSGTCEIVESNEELNSIQHDRGTSPPSSEFGVDEKSGKLPTLKVERPYSVEDDLNQLFEAIDLRLSGRRSGLSHKLCTDLSRKSALKRPITVSGSRASGIGVSESGSLKQALRGLCLSHASEMAAMKRLSKPTGQSRGSEAGAIKRLYKAVVVEASESGLPLGKGKESVLELPVVPEKEISNTYENVSESLKIPKTKPKSRSANSSPRLAVATTSKVAVNKTLPKDEIATVLSKDKKDLSVQKLGHKGKLKATSSSTSSNTTIRELELDEIIPASTEVERRTSIPEVYSLPCSPISRAASPTTEPMASSPRMGKPVLMNKSFIKKKLKQVSASSPTRFSRQNEGNNVGLHPNSSKLVCEIHNCNEKNDIKHSASPASSSTSLSVGVSSSNAALSASKPGLSSNICVDRTTGAKAGESSRSKEKGESSQSSKSSIGEYSSSTTTTSISEDSILSGSNYTGSRPHMSKDLRWDAIHHVEMQHGGIGLKHFKLLKRLGCGDIGTVYLAELTGTNGLFALKVMDNEFLASRKKLTRAQTEREILQMLDHPFLPTLFAYFTTGKFSCLVMEYCPGGDLHILRQRQDSRTFSEQAARFYLAEVLLALEYLHMLGVVYRDLKPENILVREDGHIMLSDFDLSLRCTVSPILIKCSSVNEPTKKLSHPCLDSRCIDPFCLQPSWGQVPCFTPKLITSAPKTQKPKPDPKPAASLLPELVAEPTSARSNSFVGTHEYLAPEIIKAEGHGNAVDWWTFGIFLYELLFGKTPFKGPGNDETLANVVFQTLKFPETPSVSVQAKDLIRGLLIKEPDNRLGSVKGATEIRQHPFFEGLNWALIRCAIPPELPKCHDPGVPANEIQKSECVIEECEQQHECVIEECEQQHLEFRMF